MEKIKIAHLYYDLMNLYGESGNIMALEKGFNDQDMYTEVIKLSINDRIDFTKYDIYYMGCGSESNQLIVNEDLLKYKNIIKDAIEDGKYFIFTGNSYELLGKYIEIYFFNSLYKLCHKIQIILFCNLLVYLFFLLLKLFLFFLNIQIE